MKTLNSQMWRLIGYCEAGLVFENTRNTDDIIINPRVRYLITVDSKEAPLLLSVGEYGIEINSKVDLGSIVKHFSYLSDLVAKSTVWSPEGKRKRKIS
jgi:hypothetical protein